MITILPVEIPAKEIVLTASPESMIVLRIDLRSNFGAPAVIQPKMEDWVRNDGALYPIKYEVLPLYTYIASHSNASLSISTYLPKNLKPKDVIYSTIFFSGYKHCSVKLKITVVKKVNLENRIIDRKIELSLPAEDILSNGEGNGFETGNSFFHSEYITKIASGLAGLEIIPAKWLVIELILTLCFSGMKIAKQHENIQLIDKLQSTKIFKNGVLIVTGSQVIHWLRINNSISSGLQAVAGNKNKHKGTLQVWESWLLGLAEIDIEKNNVFSCNHNEMELPQDVDFGFIIEEIGSEPEKGFLYFLLGLMEISPRINDVVRQVCANVKETKIKHDRTIKKNSKNVLKEPESLQR